MGRIMVSLLLTVCACVFSILNTEAKPQYGDWWANNRAPQYGDWWANNRGSPCCLNLCKPNSCKCVCNRNRGQYGNYGPMFRRQPPNYMNWWARPTPQLPQYGPQLPQYGNYGGWGLPLPLPYEWGAAGSQSHAGPWSHILMGK